MEALKKPKPAANHSSQADAKSAFFGVQAKLAVNKPGDQYEVEADQMAETVVSKQKTPAAAFTPSTSAVQLKEEEQQPEVVQQKPLADSVTPYIQRKEEDLQAKEEEEVQAKEDEEPAQMKEEEEVQAKEDEEPAQMKEEEDVQAKEDEEPAQMKEDEESAQMKEEEDVQAKEDEEPAQMKEEEEVQAKEDEEPAQMKEEEEVQAKEDEEPAQMKEEEEVQAKAEPAAPVSEPPTINDKLRSSKGSGSVLAEPVRNEMESGFGADFSSVRIHTDSRASQMNKEIGAKAFTSKGDIYFNEGKFNPGTPEGKTLLAHELTHTLQQGAATPKAGVQQEAAPATDKKDRPNGQAGGQPEAATETTEEQAAGTQAGGAAASPAASSGGSEPKIPKAVEVADKGAPVTVGDLVPGKEAAAEGGEEEEVVEEEPGIERDPMKNPDFQQVLGKVDNESDEQTDHEPSEELSVGAQEAALSPSNERESIAQADQVDEMDQQEPQEFSAANFKAMLMKRIEEMQLPENNDEADKFDEHNNIDEVNKEAIGDVNKEKDAAAGPIEQSKDKAPNTSAVPERKVEALKEPEKGKKPGNVGATKAIPQTRPESEVSKPLKDDAAEMDTKMAENNVTDHQLEISQEPKFQQGLESKNTAKANAESAPVALREQEQGVLNNNAAKAEKKSQNQLAGMNALRGTAVNQVVGNQKATGSKDTGERERIAGEINQIYETTKTDVTGILDDLEAKVTRMFEYGSKVAKQKFEDFVALKMARYKAERYSGVTGAAAWTYDLFAGLPDEVNEFFVEGREVFIEKMDEAITLIAEVVATELKRAKQRIEQGKQEVDTYVKDLPANLKKFGKEAADEIQDKFADLQNDVNSKQEELVDTLAQEYVASLQEVDERIEEMKAANRGLIDMAMDFINGIIDTINKLIELINSLLSAIASVINVIMADPIGFMENLFDGIGQGIDLFKANIQKHLLGGLLEWLTGTLGPIGITIPNDIFSLGGIFSLVMQVLGLGWDMLRAKSVKMMGEPAVKALETGADAGFSVFQAIKTGGIAGLWEFAKEKFTDLKEMVIDAIKDMLITQVIEAGIKWLLSLLIPGAGFIKAIMAIKDVIVFFVESAIMLIPSLIEAIMALAAGSVAGVAKAIEIGLGRLIPLVIGLLAKLIGLGGLSKKVMKIFKKIRKRVDKMVNKLLAKAKKAAKKLFKKGKTKLKGVVGKLIKWWKHKKKFKDKNNQEHTLFFEGKGKGSVLMMKSVKKQVKNHINEHKKDPNTRAKALDAETAYDRFVAARELALKAGKTPQEDQRRANDLLTAINDLSLKLRELTGDFVPADYPAAADIAFSSDGNKPGNVKIHYLTDVVPYGSPPGNGANVTGWPEVQRLGLTGNGVDDPWIQFHLINDHFSGQGNPDNLVPTPNSINKAYQKFENKVHALIFKSEKRHTNSNAPNDKNVVWMNVKVVYYKGDAGDYAKEIHAVAGIYHYRPKEGKSNLREKWIQDTKPVFTSDLEVPNPKLMVRGVNLGKSGQQHIKSFFDEKGITYSNTLIDEIVNQRLYSGKEDLINKMMAVLLNKGIDPTTPRATADNIRIKMNKILRYFDNNLDVKQ